MSTNFEDIRTILNRIDGVNVPVQEDDNSDYIKQAYMLAVKHHTDGSGDGNINEDIGDLIEDYNEKADKKISPEQIMRISKKYNAGGDYVEVLSAEGIDGKLWLEVAKEYYAQLESAVQEDDGDERAIAAMKLAKDENRKEGFDYPQGGKYGYKAERGSGTGAMGTMQVNVTIHDRETDETMYIKDMNYLELEKGDEQETLAMIWDENRDLIQRESADSGELSRLKELSGIEENAKVNFSPEQIKQLMMWNKKYSVYSGKNGDELPSGLVKANTDSGITSDGYEENEVKQYEKMFGKEEFDWDDSQHSEFQEKSKITGGMMSDLEKIVGVGNADDEYTLAEIGEKILGMSFGDTYEEQYQPFPEGDEFNIEDDEDFEEVLGPLGFPEDETELFDAEYRGRKVPLNKPMRGDVKKFKVYVKDPKTGNVKKVNFGHGGSSARKAGQKTMKIRKSNPKARKSFRARHNCANPGPKTKARYWSCRKW
tara:strand:- start:37501 stop:38949 length:1449 start_codon:yes stop_codon:yes gene_type:complete